MTMHRELKTNVLKIFLPIQCLHERSGLLVGLESRNQHTVCVTALVKTSTYSSNIDKWLSCSKTSADHRISVVGVWENVIAKQKTNGYVWNKLQLPLERWFCLRKTRVNPHCILHGTWPSVMTTEDVVIVLYDAHRLFESYHLMGRALDSQIQPGIASKPLTDITLVAYSLLLYSTLAKSTGHFDMIVADFVHKNKWHNTRVVDRVHCQFVSVLLWMINFVSWDFSPSLCFAWWQAFWQAKTFGENTDSERLLQNRIVQVLMSTPAVTSQLATRFSDVYRVLQFPWQRHPTQRLKCADVLCCHLLDVCLGIILMLVLLHGDTTDRLSTAMMIWADNVVFELQRLLHWMMGVPAGLKLNTQLDQFLCKFFLYHIYLWTGYLHLLRPVMSSAIWYISLSGCLGVSLQLSLIQDLLSMMTLHIYCFYVYAARLYHLQMVALSSLWRLFRGKKWNVLRKRVDSASYDVDQLFMGTLFFTILLFLLPTTALYYGVFVVLRLVVLALQGTLCKLVSVINSLPVYRLCLRVFCPAAITDAVKMEVLSESMADESGSPHCLCISMKFLPASVASLFNGNCNSVDSAATYTWSSFCSCLLQGQLVYPWIKPERRRPANKAG